ncbi:LysR family transcriptional regulator [Serratia ureilytica]|uniref:LysR family transcriptional regulator n=1 Tax=Serratia ureilytica TaxID=300181 RepID=UPI001C0F96EA|nr:LysR family transcriptional regulator [Serratia ureilytica]MBU5412446.1 LysR family transcriptional regulator [Serratia ureilytica]
MPIKRKLLSSHYRYFFSVAEKKSLTAASESLFVTTSAISKSLATLETSLGYRLLIRDNSGIRLTDKGSALYLALQNLQKSTEFNTLVKQMSLSQPSINLATDSLMCRQIENLLPKIQEYKYADIRLLYSKGGDILPKVISGELDMVTIYNPKSPIPSSLISHPIPVSPLSFFTIKKGVVTGKEKKLIIFPEELYQNHIFQDMVSLINENIGNPDGILFLPNPSDILRTLTSLNATILLPSDINDHIKTKGLDILKSNIIPEKIPIKRMLIYSRKRHLEFSSLADGIIKYGNQTAAN